MADTLPTEAPEGARQMFKLVDAHTAPENLKGEGGCGCGGHGHGGGGCGCGGHGRGRGHTSAEGEAASASEQTETAQGGCGCGGHGGGHHHGGGHGAGGCGCGGHGHGHGHAHGAAASTRVEELEIHAIPKVVRHATLFAAVDAIPVGEFLQILAPHRPEPLFRHLEESESHYRVETVEAGPTNWRYRIIRMS